MTPDPEAAAAPPPLDLLRFLQAIIDEHGANDHAWLVREAMRLRSLHAATEGARLRELAREAAKHNHDRQFNVLHDRHGHVFQSNNDETADGVWGFSTCPHPDCVLVRSAPAPVVAEGALRALEAKWRENAVAAGAIVEQYSHGGDWARNGFAFLKERRIWTTCADALAALLPAPRQ